MSSQSFLFQAGVQAVGPIIGSGVIGVLLWVLAERAQNRRDQLHRQYIFADQMLRTASALYMKTQRYWRVKSGRDPTAKDLSVLKADLDTEYDRMRAEGLVLENSLKLFFKADEPRKYWHRTMDFLTVRYFQLWQEDQARMDALYKTNSGPEHTDCNAEELRNPKILLDGYRAALEKAASLVFVEPIQGKRSLRAVNSKAEPVASDVVPDG